MGGKEDCGDDNERQIVVITDDARCFHRAYLLAGIANLVLNVAMIGFGYLLVMGGSLDTVSIVMMAVGFFVLVTLYHVIVALKLAVETEEERCEEIENYRDLSSRVCLREIRKG
jgi:hypothetical protein